MRNVGDGEFLDLLADSVATYIRDGGALSISERSGIYEVVEDRLQHLNGVKHAILYSSGTAAISAAFYALGLHPGDEVICPAWTFFATITPAMYMGLRPVLVDVEPDTGNIDIERARDVITKRTKALVIVHSWGHPADTAGAIKLARDNGLFIVEDCAHSPFAATTEGVVGTFGDVSILSFHENKVVNGGEGGALLTVRDDVYERATLFGHFLGRALGTGTLGSKFSETGVGLKLRMHPLAAVMVNAQLTNILSVLDARQKIFLDLSCQLRELGVTPYARRTYVTRQVYYTYKLITSDADQFSKLVAKLRSKKLKADRPTSRPLAQYPLFSDQAILPQHLEFQSNRNEFPVAESLWARTISLRTGQTIEHALDVANRVMSALGEGILI